jgi:hypothetical protein
LRQTGRSGFQADIAFLRTLFLHGGIVVVAGDAAPALPRARLLLQPDADVVLTLSSVGIADPAFEAAVGDMLGALAARMQAVARPLDAIWTLTHSTSLPLYAGATWWWVSSLQEIAFQAAAAVIGPALGLVAATLLRRLALRLLLRTSPGPARPAPD